MLALPIEERAQLLEHPLLSFQGPSDSRLDEQWIAEAHDRLAAFDRGDIDAVEVDEVMKNLTSHEK